MALAEVQGSFGVELPAGQIVLGQRVVAVALFYEASAQAAHGPIGQREVSGTVVSTPAADNDGFVHIQPKSEKPGRSEPVYVLPAGHGPAVHNLRKVSSEVHYYSSDQVNPPAAAV